MSRSSPYDSGEDTSSPGGNHDHRVSNQPGSADRREKVPGEPELELLRLGGRALLVEGLGRGKDPEMTLERQSS